MKKTIAILLILVIGMVGVFAANSTADLRLKTTVEPIDVMVIVAKGDSLSLTDFTGDATALPPTSGYPNQTYSSFTDAADAVTLDDDLSTAQDVGKLYTYSNRRVYRVDITASPLSSASSIQGQDPALMHYEVSANGIINTYKTNGSEQSAVTVFTTSAGGSSGAAIGANGVMISVKMLTAKSAVPSGEYTGAITFEYIAN